MQLVNCSEEGCELLLEGRLDHTEGRSGEFLAGVSSWAKVEESEIMTEDALLLTLCLNFSKL